MKEQPELKIVEVSVSELVPYVNNAKKHSDYQVDTIAASIQEFGNCDPIGVWHNAEGEMEIVEGHGRVLALKKLGIEIAPVIYLDHLTDHQRRTYAHVHNQTTLNSGFDVELLEQDIEQLDFDWESFGFGAAFSGISDSVDFSNLDALSGEGDEGYDEFVEKFKPKKTTDDCYTPPEVYEVIKDWACKEYGIDPAKVVRPFYPGGDYERFDYSGGKVVIDNPPFSILSKIIGFYVERGIPFFLFCPTLTGLGSRSTVMDACHLICGCSIVYENGASVNTSFVTSYGGDVVARTAPELRKIVDAKVEELQKKGKAELPKYEYPDEVITAAILGRWSKYGVEFEVSSRDCTPISKLDAQEESGAAIYGGCSYSSVKRDSSF